MIVLFLLGSVVVGIAMGIGGVYWTVIHGPDTSAPW